MSTRVSDTHSDTQMGRGFGNAISLDKNENPENLKKTFRDPNASIDDTMDALAKLHVLNSVKILDGTASDDEKTQYRLMSDLRDRGISDSDRDQLASLLGMSSERMAEVQKQFQV